jgi:hypothetical protein
MSLTVFLAFCILGCDFMLVVLFQWLYGEKHRGLKARRAPHKQAAPPSPLYWVHAKRSSQTNPSTSKSPAKPSRGNVTKSNSPASTVRSEEELAYQRIVPFARRTA